ILAFRLLWQLFGLRTYVPYLVLVVTLHLVAAAVLRVVMLRVGVGPWLATAAATTFALFGPGWFNIEYSFQSAWCATLALGFGYLMLVDHSGPIDRRDWIGLGLGLAALMCVGVSTTMIVVVGVAVLLRRGWRPALLHAGTLGAVYVLWFATIGHQGYTRRASLTEAFRFTARELSGTFGAIGGHLWGVGAALFVLLCVGLTLAWGPLRGAELRERAAVPAALLFGAITFLFVTGLGRGADFALGTPPGPASRYRYVAAVLILPVLAVAAEALSRRSKVLAPIALALLVLGVPSNVRVAADNAPDWRVYKELILSSPHLPVFANVPRSMQPDRFGNLWLTMGWLRDGIASGRIPRPGALTPARVAFLSVYLALQPEERPQRHPCVTLRRTVIRVLTAGQTFTLHGKLTVEYEPVGGTASPSRLLEPGSYAAVAGPLRLRVSPASPNTVVCW
ncbi:MAG: hypothetical protein QOJ71_1226, partial [Actinomycetota bacterium]|nr:hypothetical protein [Actinomycetota bacterium]